MLIQWQKLVWWWNNYRVLLNPQEQGCSVHPNSTAEKSKWITSPYPSTCWLVSRLALKGQISASSSPCVTPVMPVQFTHVTRSRIWSYPSQVYDWGECLMCWVKPPRTESGDILNIPPWCNLGSPLDQVAVFIVLPYEGRTSELEQLCNSKPGMHHSEPAGSVHKSRGIVETSQWDTFFFLLL